jgi:AraC-like DNA-binding protein
MTLAPADLSRPLIDADAQLGAVLRERAARVIAQAATPAWAGRVRQVITAHLADEGLSLSAAGRQLALSPRSLQRRLEAEGTTWSETVDEVRRDRAAVLLAQGFSKTAVTARLGFSDASALRSALRRWGADLAH